MVVMFNNIPGNIRVPLFYAEFNPGGTPYQAIARLLLVGQMLPTGSAEPNMPILMRDGQEDGYFGLNSMLAEMYRTARENAPFQEIWAAPLMDDAAGVAATGALTLNGLDTISQVSVMTIYIAGIRVRAVVLTSDTDESFAATLAAEINIAPHMPVTAEVDGVNPKKILLTAIHKGTMGNEISIDTDLLGDENNLADTHLTIVAMANGQADPDITLVFDALGDDEFDWIAAPYSDPMTLGAVDDLLNDEAGRWSPIMQLYGHYITAVEANLAELSTLGLGLNNQHLCILGYYKSPTPPWIWAAATGGKAAMHLQSAPELSRPLQTLDLRNVHAPKIVDRFNIQERQVLYYDGIACYHVERDGTVSIDRLITTYQLNEWGSPDATWLDVETLAQSMYGIRYLKQKVTNAHARQALADANPFGLQGVTTADDVRSTVVHGYAELIRLGVFENLDLFERDLIVERDDVDANRINIYMPLDHVNQLRIIAVNATSFMQRRSAVESLISL